MLPAPKLKSILVIARQGIIREALQSLLRTMPAVEVLTAIEAEAAALQVVQTRHPAVALIDCDLSTENALGLVRQIKQTQPDTRCVVLIDDLGQQPQALAAGADAVLLHGFSALQLQQTLEPPVSQSTLLNFHE